VIDTGTGQSCNAGKEAALNWNRSGPPGAPGPSDAYTWRGSHQIPGDETHHDIASASLPPGSFVVSVVLSVQAANTSGGTLITCVILQDGGEIYNGGGRMSVEASRVVIMPMLARAILRNATPLTLTCWAFGAEVTIDAFAVATKIGTIHDL
jgi:hypothetical protein